MFIRDLWWPSLSNGWTSPASLCTLLVLGVEDETGVFEETKMVFGDELLAVTVAIVQLVFATVLTESTREGDESVVDSVF